MKRTNSIDIEIGKRLRIARKLRGLSQQKLANMLDNPITFQQMQKYEKGTNRISASKLIEICNALNVSISYFSEGIEKDAVIKSVPDFIIEISNDLLVLSEKMQITLLRVIRDVKGDNEQ